MVLGAGTTVMDGFVLAAGRGDRLRPLTLRVPKALVSVGGVKMIVRHLQAMAACGIGDIFVNLGYRGQQIRRYVDNHLVLPAAARVHYLDEGNDLLGTGGGSVKMLQQSTADTLLIINADVYTDYIFDKNFKFRKNIQAHLILVDNPSDSAGDFFLADSGILGGKRESDNLTYSGIGYFTRVFFSGRPMIFSKLEDFIRDAMAVKNVTAEHFYGQWNDIGTPHSLAQARRAARCYRARK